jgi:hypothetical protein
VPNTVPKYEYRVSSADDDQTEVNKVMAQWAEAGWELVSGSVTHWVAGEYTRGVLKPVGHFRFVMYWRRSIVT